MQCGTDAASASIPNSWPRLLPMQGKRCPISELLTDIEVKVTGNTLAVSRNSSRQALIIIVARTTSLRCNWHC